MSHHTIKQAQHCDVIAALELQPFDLVAATLFLFGMRCQQTVVNIDAIATIRQLVELIDGSEQVVRHRDRRSEEYTSELQSLMRISYAVFCLKKKTTK